MSQEAVRVKEETACAVTDHVAIKLEPELNEAKWVNDEAEYVPPLCVLQEVCTQLEPACTKQESCAPPEAVCELEPVYTELETVCFKDEPICVQQPVCVKEEPPWQESVSTELDQEFKYDIPLEQGPLPAEPLNAPPRGSSCAVLRDHMYATTEYPPADAQRINWECFVRLERCVVPRDAALRLERRERAAASRATARRQLSGAHEREIAIKHLSGSLIKRIDKIRKSHTCEICKKQYKSWACLTTHKLSHTKKSRSQKIRSEKNTYFCEICKAVFYDLDSLKVHALIHANMTIPLHVCGICQRKFATNYALRTHKRAHLRARPFRCYLCNQRFSRPNDLSRHFAAHTARKHRLTLTPLCKACETKHALKQLGGLLRSEHGQTSENIDFCEQCNNCV